MERRIIILSDNRTDTPLLGTEHGLSAYMEYGGRRYLLDTGASDLFMLNAEQANRYEEILSKIDYSVYKNKPVIVKGCSRKPVPMRAYILAANNLQSFARSIMYGEACSAVPLYKESKK